LNISTDYDVHVGLCDNASTLDRDVEDGCQSHVNGEVPRYSKYKYSVSLTNNCGEKKLSTMGFIVLVMIVMGLSQRMNQMIKWYVCLSRITNVYLDLTRLTSYRLADL